jgi:hypothetical protein
MAIVLENTTTRAENASGSNPSWSYTVPANTTFLELSLAIGYYDGLPSAVTYNSVSMTLLGSRIALSAGYLQVWGVVNPASGAHDFVLTSAAFVAGVTHRAWSGTTTYRTVALANDQYVQDNGTVKPSASATSVSGDTVVSSQCWRIGETNYSALVPATGVEDSEFKSTHGSASLNAVTATSHETATTTTTTITWNPTQGAGAGCNWAIAVWAYIPTSSGISRTDVSLSILA